MFKGVLCILPAVCHMISQTYSFLRNALHNMHRQAKSRLKYENY